jgi:amino acid transporter
MGRIRIKKKDRVLPFRRTVAYRFIIVAVAALLFAIAVFQVVTALMSGNTPILVIASLAAAGAAFLGLHSFSRMQTAKIPRQTLQRMKRR